MERTSGGNSRRPHTRKHAAVTKQQKQFGVKPRSEAATMRTNKSNVRMRGGATLGRAMRQHDVDNQQANKIGVQTRSVALSKNTPTPILAHSEAGLLLTKKLWLTAISNKEGGQNNPALTKSAFLPEVHSQVMLCVLVVIKITCYVSVVQPKHFSYPYF